MVASFMSQPNWPKQTCVAGPRRERGCWHGFPPRQEPQRHATRGACLGIKVADVVQQPCLENLVEVI